MEGSGGHNTLLRVAKAIVQGFDVSEDQAFRLLAEEYNPRCAPPWNLGEPGELKDFRRKVSEANKLPCDSPRGWLRDEGFGDGLETMDFSELLSSRRVNAVEVCSPKFTEDAPSKQPVQPVDRRIPRELLRVPGFLGEYISYCMEAAPYPNAPIAHLWWTCSDFRNHGPQDSGSYRLENKPLCYCPSSGWVLAETLHEP